jgi:hypothetical protein
VIAQVFQVLRRLYLFQVMILVCCSIITGDNGGKSFIPGKLETSWVDELTDYADTFLEDEETRHANLRQKYL